jgi:crotonobetainyl-CoA:carnitine CoA-transferase CaiB-like acyl-CoA transferase
MSKTPSRIRLPAVRLGEHNEYVYKEVLGVSDEEYAQLEREGHIGMDLVPGLEIGKYKPE